MATITDIKRKIIELAPAPFQEFCDSLIYKNGYGSVCGLGMKAGTGKTTIGNPDTYFRSNNGKYVLVAYTTQQEDIFNKLKEDIDKCLDTTKTGLDIADIDEIICCHTSSNLTAGDDKKLHDYCNDYGIRLTIWGIDEIANQVYSRFRSLAKDGLGLSIDTNQILSIDDFITQYDANGMCAPLNTVFQFREKEIEEIEKALDINTAVIVTGKAGVGKTRIVLEIIREYCSIHGYRLLCIKNNNLGLYEDLISAIDNPGKYLFFVDDANELAQLNHILEYTKKEDFGYIVKIIVTVRDYARKDVIFNIKKYCNPAIIEMSTFSDKEIEDFLKENLKIVNRDYLEQIIRISEGNPRIAYMAGRLAIEKQNISSIKDVSQLYDTYYEKYVNGELGSDRELCFTVGVLSIINAAMLDDISVLKELFDNYGISNEKFIECIYKLSELEVVEIQMNKIASLSDQCLANYMIYYVFFQKKIVSLSSVLEIGYKNYRKGVFRAINTILNIFESKETKKCCEQEILKVWEKYEKDNSPCYEEFTKDFHIFNPEKSFAIAQKRIKSINSENFNIFDVNFSKNSYCHEEDILEYLAGYQYSDYLNYVIELLLQVTSKSETMLVIGYKWLENNYGINVDDYKYKYYTQKEIGRYLYERILQDEITAKIIGFQWSKYILDFSFNSTRAGRNNTYVFYDLQLKESEGLDECREVCWKILITLANDDEWKDKLIAFINEYSERLNKCSDKAIVENELSYVNNIFDILKCKRIGYLQAVQRLLVSGQYLDIKFDERLKNLLVGDEWKIYQLLGNDFVNSELNYKEYEKTRNEKLNNFGKEITISEINDFVNSVCTILSDSIIEQDSYEINNGLETIVQQFDAAKLNEFLYAFIKNGNNISIRPYIVLERLNQKNESLNLLEVIKDSNFSQKNEWLYSFFETLPEDEVNKNMLDELLIFLKDTSDKEIHCSSFRSLRLLDKFVKIEPNIYPIASTIIFNKREYSGFIVKIYFELLFNSYAYSPKELLLLFKNDINILKNIYFFVLKNDHHIDYDGAFLSEFLLLGNDWLEEYTNVFWSNIENHIDNSTELINALWASDKYVEFFDYIFYRFPHESVYIWRLKYAFKDVLKHDANNKVANIHKEEWIKHIIKENASSNNIVTIFEIICELDEQTRTESVKTFLENNADFSFFDKLRLLPSSYFGNGSLIPIYQKQIDYLESLFPYVSNICFLEHKTKIISEKEKLKEIIKHEEIEEIYRNLYM